jgi:hypothetical protein
MTDYSIRFETGLGRVQYPGMNTEFDYCKIVGRTGNGSFRDKRTMNIGYKNLESTILRRTVYLQSGGLICHNGK